MCPQINVLDFGNSVSEGRSEQEWCPRVGTSWQRWRTDSLQWTAAIPPRRNKGWPSWRRVLPFGQQKQDLTNLIQLSNLCALEPHWRMHSALSAFLLLLISSVKVSVNDKSPTSFRFYRLQVRPDPNPFPLKSVSVKFFHLCLSEM